LFSRGGHGFAELVQVIEALLDCGDRPPELGGELIDRKTRGAGNQMRIVVGRPGRSSRRGKRDAALPSEGIYVHLDRRNSSTEMGRHLGVGHFADMIE
jgi:hypothetical protein